MDFSQINESVVFSTTSPKLYKCQMQKEKSYIFMYSCQIWRALNRDLNSALSAYPLSPDFDHTPVLPDGLDQIPQRENTIYSYTNNSE